MIESTGLLTTIVLTAIILTIGIMGAVTILRMMFTAVYGENPLSKEYWGEYAIPTLLTSAIVFIACLIAAAGNICSN